MEKHLNKASVVLSGAEQPAIYVVCLDSYHDGNIYGVWIDATQAVKDISGLNFRCVYYFNDRFVSDEDYEHG